MAAPFPSLRETITGDAGLLELVSHIPNSVSPRAVAVIAHPHPLFGGTMDNKVVTTLARACFDAGAAVFRFNFRGVGASEGVHDEGRGECDDMLCVINHATGLFPGLPLWLAGFSFGGAVTLAVSERIACDEMVLVAPAFKRMSHWSYVSHGGKPPDPTLVFHGEHDETVPLADSLDWARPRDIPVVVIPGADHFFHQRLTAIKRLTKRFLSAGF